MVMSIYVKNFWGPEQYILVQNVAEIQDDAELSIRIKKV